MTTEQSEALLRAVTDLRADMRADLQQMRMDMQTVRADMQQALQRTVDRDTHAAQLAALERRVETLEQARARTVSSVLSGLVYPMLVMLLGPAVVYLLVARGGH